MLSQAPEHDHSLPNQGNYDVEVSEPTLVRESELELDSVAAAFGDRLRDERVADSICRFVC